MSAPPKLLRVATIGGAHGVKGEVRIRSLTQEPLDFAGYGPLLDDTGKSMEVATVRAGGKSIIAAFKGITSREEAEKLNGTGLWIDRSLLPDTEDEEEFYVADLVGLRVADEAGNEMGSVVQVHDFGAGDIIEIRFSSGGKEMFSFTRDNFPTIDFERGVLVFIRPDTVTLDEEGRDRQ